MRNAERDEVRKKYSETLDALDELRFHSIRQQKSLEGFGEDKMNKYRECLESIERSCDQYFTTIRHYRDHELIS